MGRSECQYQFGGVRLGRWCSLWGSRFLDVLGWKEKVWKCGFSFSVSWRALGIRKWLYGVIPENKNVRYSNKFKLQGGE
jgi:hypothetical protein